MGRVWCSVAAAVKVLVVNRTEEEAGIRITGVVAFTAFAATWPSHCRNF